MVGIHKNAAWNASLRAVNALSPEIRAAFAAWFSALTGLTTTEIEKAIDAGSVGAVVASIWDEAAENEGIDDLDARLQAELERVVAEMVKAAGLSQWKSLDIVATFTLDNPYSIAWIPAYAAEQVTLVSDATKEAIAEIVERGFIEGNPPREMAREIRDMIGLLPQQARSLANYRAGLVAAGESPARVAKLVERRHQQMLTDRAEMIARTETIDAHANGALQSWRTARDRGFIPMGTRKVWSAATASERTCPICQALHGKVIELDGEFSAVYQMSPESAPKSITKMAPTAHPRCRCAMKLEIVRTDQ